VAWTNAGWRVLREGRFPIAELPAIG
jgi:hypothetical protein